MPSKTIIELSEIFFRRGISFFLVSGNVFFRGILRPRPNVELFTRQTKLSAVEFMKSSPDVYTQLSSSE